MFLSLQVRPPYAAQRAKFSEKVHKPPLRVNVINFEVNVFNVPYGSLGVPQTTELVVMHGFKFIRCVKKYIKKLSFSK